MSKLYYKTKTFYEPIYDIHIRWVNSNDDAKTYKKYGVTISNFRGYTIFNNEKIKGELRACGTIIMNPDYIKESLPMTIDTITHETDHLAGFILKSRGVKPKWVSEPKAYLTGWLARELSKFLFTK